MFGMVVFRGFRRCLRCFLCCDVRWRVPIMFVRAVRYCPVMPCHVLLGVDMECMYVTLCVADYCVFATVL